MNADVLCLLATRFLTPWDVIRLGCTCKAMGFFLRSPRIWKCIVSRVFRVWPSPVEGHVDCKTFMRLFSGGSNSDWWRPSMQAPGMIKFCMYGSAQSGKTCALRALCDDPVPADYQPTIGVDFGNRVLSLDAAGVAEVPTRLQVWDTAGRSRFRSIVAAYSRSARVLVFFFDMSNSGSWCETLEIAKDMSCYVQSTQTVVAVGSKVDRREEFVDLSVAAAMLKNCLNLPQKPLMYECSALEKEGVVRMFKSIAEVVYFPMGHQIADACGVPKAVREREPFNRWLWRLEDPGAGLVAKKLKPLQRFVDQLLEAWRYPNATPSYLVLNK